MFLNPQRALPLVNAIAESGELDNSLGNMDNQILGTRSPTRASILVSRPSIQNTCGVYPHAYFTNYHSQSIQEYRPFQVRIIQEHMIHLIKLYKMIVLLRINQVPSNNIDKAIRPNLTKERTFFVIELSDDNIHHTYSSLIFAQHNIKVQIIEFSFQTHIHINFFNIRIVFNLKWRKAKIYIKMKLENEKIFPIVRIDLSIY